jgi:hypothetical protein
VGTAKAAADLIPCTKGAGLLSLLFCFVEGTLVETADGPMPIEHIEVGMWVRATDPTALSSLSAAGTNEEESVGWEWEYVWVGGAVLVAACVAKHRRRQKRRHSDPLDELLAAGLGSGPELELDVEDAMDARDPLALELLAARTELKQQVQEPGLSQRQDNQDDELEEQIMHDNPSEATDELLCGGRGTAVGKKRVGRDRGRSARSGPGRRALAAGAAALFVWLSSLCLGTPPSDPDRDRTCSSHIRPVAMSAQQRAQHQRPRAAPSDTAALDPVPEVAVTYTYGEPYGEAEVTYIFAADDIIPGADDEVVVAEELSPGDRIMLDGDVLGTVKDVRPIPLGQRAPPGYAVSELESSGYRRVIGTVKHIANTVIDITYAGDTLTATPDHPFWVVNRNDWVRAGDLRSGDRLATAAGRTLSIEAVSAPRQGEFTVYNLEVEGLHTYHAGKHAVLVHNGPVCLRKLLPAIYRGYGIIDRTTGEILKFGITRRGHNAAGVLIRGVEQAGKVARRTGVPRANQEVIELISGMTRRQAFDWERGTVEWFRSLRHRLRANPGRPPY